MDFQDLDPELAEAEKIGEAVKMCVGKRKEATPDADERTFFDECNKRERVRAAMEDYSVDGIVPTDPELAELVKAVAECMETRVDISGEEKFDSCYAQANGTEDEGGPQVPPAESTMPTDEVAQLKANPAFQAFVEKERQLKAAAQDAKDKHICPAIEYVPACRSVTPEEGCENFFTSGVGAHKVAQEFVGVAPSFYMCVQTTSEGCRNGKGAFEDGLTSGNPHLGAFKKQICKMEDGQDGAPWGGKPYNHDDPSSEEFGTSFPKCTCGVMRAMMMASLATREADFKGGDALFVKILGGAALGSAAMFAAPGLPVLAAGAAAAVAGGAVVDRVEKVAGTRLPGAPNSAQGGNKYGLYGTHGQSHPRFRSMRGKQQETGK